MNSESGQGTVEYILMLIITVAIILGLSAQFYQPFGKWTQFWLGEYVVCLLDRGQLPSLLDSTQADPCLEGGGPGFVAGNSDLGGSSGPTDRRGLTDGESAASGSRSNQSGAGDFAGSASRGSGSGGTDGPQSDAKTTRIPIESLPESQFYSVSRSAAESAVSGRRVGQLSVNNLVAWEREKIKRRESRVFKVSTLDTQETDGRNRKMLRIVPQPKKSIEQVDFEVWSFGKYIRLILIVIIIVFTVFFLFIQGVRIAKSMEKAS